MAQGQSEHTIVKQRRRLMPLLQIVTTAMKNRADRLVIVDIFAGCGRNHTVGEDGSPILALRTLSAMRQPGHVLAFEIETKPRRELQDRLLVEQRRMGAGVEVAVFRDNRDQAAVSAALATVPTSAALYGLVYADPNGATIPLDTIAHIVHAPGWSRVDVLLHFSATALKRARQASHMPVLAHWADVTPQGWMTEIGKRAWWITESEPGDSDQWTFLFGSNWTAFPGLDRYGFVPVRSAAGLDRLARTITTRAQQGARPNG